MSCLVIKCLLFGPQWHFSALVSFVWSCMFLCSPGLYYTFLRQWLSRYQISAHTLRIESGCYTSPVTLIVDRKCKYCRNGLIDDEKHFILVCEICRIKSKCFLNRLNVLNKKFGKMTHEEKLAFILCPLSYTL